MDTARIKFSGYTNDINRVVSEAFTSQFDHQHGAKTQLPPGINQPQFNSNDSYGSTPLINFDNFLPDDTGLPARRYYILDDTKPLSTTSRPLPMPRNSEKAHNFVISPNYESTRKFRQINYDRRPSSCLDASDLYLQRFQREKDVWRKYVKILIVALLIAILIAVLLLLFVVLLAVGVIEPSSKSTIQADSTPNSVVSETTASASVGETTVTQISSSTDSTHLIDPILQTTKDTGPKTSTTQRVTFPRIIIGNDNQVT